NTHSQAWLKSLANVLQTGGIILVDYGYSEREYFHPQRNKGTLMCHYRHHSHDEPFYLPGLQDITAHVNFSDIAQVASKHKLELQGYTTQAHFLMSGGLQELSEQFDLTDTLKLAELSRQIKMLTLPSEMGELFKVIAFSKNIDKPISGFDFINMQDKL
ncbi:MAG: SAM-dependent methyltransferase, partial [Gammaproteobacteria bacterium]|nr:SAM-dependent methyltransferase [Gammaproteobacteria bacterium]